MGSSSEKTFGQELSNAEKSFRQEPDGQELLTDTRSFEQDLAEQVELCRAGVQADPRVSVAIRKDRLRRVLALLKEGHQSLLEAMEADFGRRCVQECETIELLPLRMAASHALSRVSRWVRGGSRWASWVTWPAQMAVDYVPVGVVGVVSPWNYPLVLSLGPMISALAAGNRVILKPSELVPHTNECLSELLSRHFAPDECALFEGGAEASKAFCAAPWDHLVFTGSTRVGQSVMQSAAKSLVPVTLELGGACPAWIDPKASLSSSLVPVIRGKLVSAGQTCVAPNHLYCPQSKLEEVIRAAPAIAQEMYPRGLDDLHYTSLISARHRGRVLSMLEEARSAGVRWIPLFQEGEPDFNCVMPGLLIDPPEELSISREEIFGPVLVIRSFDDSAQAIPEALKKELVERPHPLAVHILSENPRHIEEIRALARTGSVIVNGLFPRMAQEGLPFGGIGASGLGHYRGHAGFLRFSHHRSFYRQKGPNGVGLVFPPYGSPLKKRAAKALRFLTS